MERGKLNRVLAATLCVLMVGGMFLFGGCAEKRDGGVTDASVPVASAPVGSKAPETTEPAVPVTVQSLMEGFSAKCDAAEYLQLDFSIQMSMDMSLYGEKSAMLMEMKMHEDLQSADAEHKNVHLSADMHSESDGKVETEVGESYLMWEDGHYVSYSADGGVWSKTIADDSVNQMDAMMKTFDVSALELKEEGSEYVVFGKVNIKDAMELMGSSVGEMGLEGLEDVNYDAVEKVDVEYRFDRNGDLISAKVDMAEALSSLMNEMYKTMFESMAGEEGLDVDLSSIFSFSVSKASVEMNNVKFDTVAVVLPDDAK